MNRNIDKASRNSVAYYEGRGSELRGAISRGAALNAAIAVNAEMMRGE
jgi:hypothetical protein